jgi:hypothetical protein
VSDTQHTFQIFFDPTTTPQCVEAIRMKRSDSLAGWLLFEDSEGNIVAAVADGTASLVKRVTRGTSS